MTERLLVLAKAMPEASRKYEELVCVAGITDKGEWRRIYPIPWNVFWPNSGTSFRKKHWIEYELVDDKPSDHRPESRKIRPGTIRDCGEESFSVIEKMLEERVTTIEELMEKGHKAVSLGVVKPEVLGFQPIDNQQYEKVLDMTKQQTLFGGKAYKLDPPEHKYQYVFKDRPGETDKHTMLCEDWEAERLYSGCKKYLQEGKYKSMDEVHEKVSSKMLEIAQTGHSYFIVGTHYRFGTYVVVGVVYPKKSDMIKEA